MQTYYERNKDEICRKKRERYRDDLDHREKKIESAIEWQKKNKEKTDIARRDYYRRNTVKILSAAVEYRKTDSYKVAQKKYNSSPKGLFSDRDCHHRRRTAKSNGTITSRQWDEALRQYNFRCAYCGVKGNMTMDHVIPLSKGGEHCIDNVVPACVECNSSKGAKLGWKPRVFKIAQGERNG